MGYEKVAEPELTLAARYRDQFPVTENLIYLNHAAVAPLCRRASDAMKQLAEDACSFGSLHYDEWLDAYESLRRAAAKLLNASAGEIAIVKNTSEGISTVALGLDWKPGDRIVAFEEEFPANYYPWLRLEQQGLQVIRLSIYDPLEKIAAAVQGARLLAVSFVNYLSGYRVNLNALGQLCREAGCFFFVDAIQGLGALPLDVQESRIDALAADGHKWMLGPEGNGILFVRREWLDRIQPVEFGWTNPAGYADYSSRDMTLRPDAGRYECGTLNTIGCFGLLAAIEFLLEIGVDQVSQTVLALADQLATGLGAKGYELMALRSAATASGIVSFRHPHIDCRTIVSELKKNKVIAAPRQDWVRMSPHFYITSEEIEQVLDLLPEC
jgi:cysteine desulfurase / selenocysteine lyase